MTNDAHCHFFSSGFLDILTSGMADLPDLGRAAAVAARVGWSDPGTPEQLADRWVEELDRNGVTRAALIASIPGDESSVASAVSRHPSRFVGFFMVNPWAPDAGERLERALTGQALRCACLFPAMHRYRLDDERVGRVFETVARHGGSVFVHCGVLTVGVRTKLGLPSVFDLRLGDPLALAVTAAAFPSVPVIVPHFGAGFFREALMAAGQCRNIHLDTSSSNGWMKYYPGLTLEAVFRQALLAVGPERLLFGTDSSFFPRGWQKGIYDAQSAALQGAGASHADRELVFGGNFARIFPCTTTSAA
ncbi:MAG TPA: amidohydrolase family protein [Vicinamibacterales bacterium]|nr:amidohydrolase family protein [Vicinamibacterales bacterium]